jgi:ornithine decarboxylase
LDHFSSAIEIVRALVPDVPVAANRPHLAKRAANWFVKNFSGQVLYAVKANPSPWIINALWDGGVRHFDVASLNEIELVKSLYPEAILAFMHPVKNRNAIRKAYYNHGCRIFSIDSDAELSKVLSATDNAKDLTLMIRLSVSNNSASLPLDNKFGVSEHEAIDLLRRARSLTREDLGICFHVGSQCMDPEAYVAAMDIAKSIILNASVVIDIIDVGGGFPVNYRGMAPPNMSLYIDAISKKFETMPVLENCELWCEPGRALVAEATSIIARVELRKGNVLFINDGAYGNLFDATHVKWPFEVTHLRTGKPSSSTFSTFKIYGPTCDSIDALETEYFLPNDVQEGDYVEFQMLGAYGITMSTKFNGFGDTIEVIADDAPHVSMFSVQAPSKDSNNSKQRIGKYEQQ